MKYKIWLLCCFGWLLLAAPVMADDSTNRTAEVTQFMKKLKLVQDLKFQQGVIKLPGGMATLNLPTNLCYLDPNDAETVLVKIWDNPPSGKSLGMLMPAGKTPVQDGCWAVTIASTDDGYVKDDDAAKLNYDEMLKQMQAGAKEESKERIAKGFPGVELAGWAEPPHYDATTHKLYWAMDLKVDGATEDTLNYDIRILGRKGYLVLGVIAGMSQLQEIRTETPQILAAVNFNEGSRYSDFDPKVDKVAAYGIGALVAGGIAAKLGLFKLLWVGLLAAKKFIVIAAIAVAAWVRKIFANRKDPAA